MAYYLDVKINLRLTNGDTHPRWTSYTFTETTQIQLASWLETTYDAAERQFPDEISEINVQLKRRPRQKYYISDRVDRPEAVRVAGELLDPDDVPREAEL